MEILKMIFMERASDYKIVNVVVKFWLAVLLVMWVLGMGSILIHLIQNPSAFDNATFGIFDTLGN